jgi:hypothetical protein
VTTDPTVPAMDADRAARLAALRDRSRAGRGATDVAPGSEPTLLPMERRSPRRRHAAFGGRILTAGLSVGAAVGLVGLMADGQIALSTTALAPPPRGGGGARAPRAGAPRSLPRPLRRELPRHRDPFSR